MLGFPPAFLAASFPKSTVQKFVAKQKLVIFDVLLIYFCICMYTAHGCGCPPHPPYPY